MKKFTLIIFATFITINFATAQKIVNTKKNVENTTTNVKEDALFTSLGYSKYIDKMTERLNGNEDLNVREQLNLADSYFFTGDYNKATEWYDGLVNDNSKAAYKLRYAQALQGSGDCDEAQKWYVAYHQSVNPDIDISTIAAPCQVSSAKYAFDMRSPFKVDNLREINSEKYDFSPAYYKNGLVFVSNNLKNAVTKDVDIWLGDNFMDLYFTEKQDDNVYSKPVPFSYELNSKFHEGPLSFTEDGRKVFFTRNNFKNGQRKKNKEGLTSLKIYSAEYVGGKWINIIELPFNDDDFVVCHPTISADGTTLYFAANFTDTRGGLDIYVSHYHKGKWSTPENLGDKVNSVNNENFPFYHNESGTLYFASNRPSGLGGIDIYQAASADVSGTIVWNEAENMDEPFNSTKDDFGFITNYNKSTGYFSSNRRGGQGFDDIYYFEKDNNSLVDESALAEIGTQNIDKTTFGNDNNNVNSYKPNGSDDPFAGGRDRKRTKNQGQICVLDDKINERISAATVKVYEVHNGSSKKVVDIQKTNNNGTFIFGFKPNRTYLFEVKKDGYRTTTYNMNVETLTNDVTLDFCIPIEPATCQKVVGFAYEAKTERILPNAIVTYVNECTGEINTTKTDADGRFEICLPCGCKHGFKVSKAGYKTRNQAYLPVESNCAKVNVVNFWLYKGQGNYLLEGNDVMLRPGEVLTLKRIFYDFDKHYIRQDATADLDDLAALMLEYPSIEIELSSHTDSRGNNSYNNKLSQRRAEAAFKYLVNKGISGNRISAIGYGETKLLNRCADGVSCSEDAHQLNRRTEVKIIRFDQEEVEVEILENMPR